MRRLGVGDKINTSLCHFLHFSEPRRDSAGGSGAWDPFENFHLSRSFGRRIGLRIRDLHCLQSSRPDADKDEPLRFAPNFVRFINCELCWVIVLKTTVNVSGLGWWNINCGGFEKGRSGTSSTSRLPNVTIIGIVTVTLVRTK